MVIRLTNPGPSFCRFRCPALVGKAGHKRFDHLGGLPPLPPKSKRAGNYCLKGSQRSPGAQPCLDRMGQERKQGLTRRKAAGAPASLALVFKESYQAHR